MRHALLGLDNLRAWAHFNDVKLFEASIESRILGEDGNDKGGGLLANAEHGPGQPFLAVPLELVLSKERVEQCSKSDRHLKELIDAAPSLFQTPRTAVLLFLIYQMTLSSPDWQGHGLGFPNPLADYVKMLPHHILLPIFYTAEERELLIGTSLSEALDQKIISLEREFETLKASTADVCWCRKLWWDDESTGCLSFDDWKLADAMYRSRAIELPRDAGVGMVPVVDMANHASDDRYNTRFEVDEDSSSVLLVARDDRTVKQGDEITIMYGCGGACEMVFSYGFLEKEASSAREIFLSLPIPSNDPLRMAKIRYAQEAPGVRIYVDDSNQVCWESSFVWWACVNQEDGLGFRVEQTLDGDMELKALWKDHELDSHAGALKSILTDERLRELYKLRAVVTIQERVERQGMELAASEDDFNHSLTSERIRPQVYQTIGRLRMLEIELLARAYEMLEEEKAALLESSVVREYLRMGQQMDDPTGNTPEDFS